MTTPAPINGLNLQLFPLQRRPFGPLSPKNITSGTPLCFIETPESINQVTPLIPAGSSPPTLALSGNLAHSYGVKVAVATTGAPGVAKVNISLNNGATNVELNVSTTPGAHTILGTDLNIVFPVSGAYSANNTWVSGGSPLTDQIGANDFSNATNTQCPQVITAGSGGFPTLRGDGTTVRLNCTTGLAQAVAGGTNKPFTVFFQVSINVLPTGANVATIATMGNTGSLARCEIQLTATGFRTRRRDDAGNESVLTSNIPAVTGFSMCCWVFDGTTSRLRIMGADVIGGKSDVAGANTVPGAVTLNNVSLYAEVTSGGTTNFCNMNLQSAVFVDGAMNLTEIQRVEQYLAIRYGYQIFSNSDVLGMAIFFAGQVKPNAALHWMSFTGQPGLMLPQDQSDSNNTTFGFRQPIRLDGVTPYWYWGGTGNPSNEQAIVDETIFMIWEAGFKGVIPLYFTRTQDIQASNQGTPAQAVMWQWFDYYQASQYRARLKFAVMVTSTFASFDANSGVQPQFPVTPGTYLNLPAMSTYFASLMADPLYLKDKTGKPFFYPYNDPSTNWTVAHVNTITAAATAEGFSGVTFVNPNESVSQATLLPAQLTSYAANSAVPAPGIGQMPYSSQIAKDRSNWTLSGASAIPKQLGITLCNDGRPVRGTSTWWVERATYSELESAIEQTFAYSRIARNQVPDQVVAASNAGELAEEGDFFPTRQTLILGVNSPTRGIILDAWHNVAHEMYPDAWWDWWRADSKATGFSRTGTWTTTGGISNGGGSNSAPFEFAVVRATAAATLTFTSTLFISPANAPRDGFQIYGTKGPGLGRFTVAVNGGLPTIVDQSDISTTYGSLLFDAGVLALGALTVVISWLSGTVELDRIGAHRPR